MLKIRFKFFRQCLLSTGAFCVSFVVPCINHVRWEMNVCLTGTDNEREIWIAQSRFNSLINMVKINSKDLGFWELTESWNQYNYRLVSTHLEILHPNSGRRECTSRSRRECGMKLRAQGWWCWHLEIANSSFLLMLLRPLLSHSKPYPRDANT